MSQATIGNVFRYLLPKMVGWVAFEVSLRWVEPVKTVKNATANLSFDLISILALRVIQSHSLRYGF